MIVMVVLVEDCVVEVFRCYLWLNSFLSVFFSFGLILLLSFFLSFLLR